jgi:hypothetical protein
MLRRLVARDIAVQIFPHVVQHLADEQRRGKILLSFDGRHDMLQCLAQPGSQVFVIVDLRQFGEQTEVQTQHLGLCRARLHCRTRDHHHQFEQQALQQIAPLLARAVDVDEDVVDDAPRLAPIAAPDGGQQHRFLKKIQFANPVVRPVFQKRDGRKIIHGSIR